MAVDPFEIDHPFRGYRLPRPRMFKVACPFTVPSGKLFDRFYALCALATFSIIVSFWLLVSHNDLSMGLSHPGQLLGQLQTSTKFDMRLVVFGDAWSDPNSGEVRVWTDFLCDPV